MGAVVFPPLDLTNPEDSLWRTLSQWKSDWDLQLDRLQIPKNERKWAGYLWVQYALNPDDGAAKAALKSALPDVFIDIPPRSSSQWLSQVALAFKSFYKDQSLDMIIKIQNSNQGIASLGSQDASSFIVMLSLAQVLGFDKELQTKDLLNPVTDFVQGELARSRATLQGYALPTEDRRTGSSSPWYQSIPPEGTHATAGAYLDPDIEDLDDYGFEPLDDDNDFETNPKFADMLEAERSMSEKLSSHHPPSTLSLDQKLSKITQKAQTFQKLYQQWQPFMQGLFTTIPQFASMHKEIQSLWAFPVMQMDDDSRMESDFEDLSLAAPLDDAYAPVSSLPPKTLVEIQLLDPIIEALSEIDAKFSRFLEEPSQAELASYQRSLHHIQATLYWLLQEQSSSLEDCDGSLVRIDTDTSPYQAASELLIKVQSKISFHALPTPPTKSEMIQFSIFCKNLVALSDPTTQVVAAYRSVEKSLNPSWSEQPGAADYYGAIDLFRHSDWKMVKIIESALPDPKDQSALASFESVLNFLSYEDQSACEQSSLSVDWSEEEDYICVDEGQQAPREYLMECLEKALEAMLQVALFKDISFDFDGQNLILRDNREQSFWDAPKEQQALFKKVQPYLDFLPPQVQARYIQKCECFMLLRDKKYSDDVFCALENIYFDIYTKSLQSTKPLPFGYLSAQDLVQTCQDFIALYGKPFEDGVLQQKTYLGSRWYPLSNQTHSLLAESYQYHFAQIKRLLPDFSLLEEEESSMLIGAVNRFERAFESFKKEKSIDPSKLQNSLEEVEGLVQSCSKNHQSSIQQAISLDLLKQKALYDGAKSYNDSFLCTPRIKKGLNSGEWKAIVSPSKKCYQLAKAFAIIETQHKKFEPVYFFENVFYPDGGQALFQTNLALVAAHMQISPDELKRDLRSLFAKSSSNQRFFKDYFQDYLWQAYASEKAHSGIAVDNLALDLFDRGLERFLDQAEAVLEKHPDILLPAESSQWRHQYVDLLKKRALLLENAGIAYQEQPLFRPTFRKHISQFEVVKGALIGDMTLKKTVRSQLSDRLRQRYKEQCQSIVDRLVDVYTRLEMLLKALKVFVTADVNKSSSRSLILSQGKERSANSRKEPFVRGQ